MTSHESTLLLQLPCSNNDEHGGDKVVRTRPQGDNKYHGDLRGQMGVDWTGTGSITVSVKFWVGCTVKGGERKMEIVTDSRRNMKMLCLSSSTVLL